MTIPKNKITDIVNHYWPNTISRLGLTEDSFPKTFSPQSFMGVYVVLFPDAVLPSEDDVNAKEADYQAYLDSLRPSSKDPSGNALLQAQIDAIEAKQARALRDIALGNINATGDPLLTPIQRLHGYETAIAALRKQIVL